MFKHIQSLQRLPILAALLALAAGGCTEPLEVDPNWASRALPQAGVPVDHVMADVGVELFSRNCAACHTIGGGEIIGPDLRGVSERRTAEWLRGMIANPDSMLRSDTIAARLLTEFVTPMLDRKLDEARVRAVIEFLWRSDHPTGAPGASVPPAGSAGADSTADSDSDSIRK